MTLLNHLTNHYDVYTASATATGVHMALCQSMVAHLENMVWSIASGLVVFVVLHFFKKLSKWKD